MLSASRSRWVAMGVVCMLIFTTITIINIRVKIDVIRTKTIMQILREIDRGSTIIEKFKNSNHKIENTIGTELTSQGSPSWKGDPERCG